MDAFGHVLISLLIFTALFPKTIGRWIRDIYDGFCEDQKGQQHDK